MISCNIQYKDDNEISTELSRHGSTKQHPSFRPCLSSVTLHIHIFKVRHRQRRQRLNNEMAVTNANLAETRLIASLIVSGHYLADVKQFTIQRNCARIKILKSET